MDASAFLSALLAIVVIDIVLAGDNAIVIALAARRLPPALQRRAILWGTVGAVVVRSAMTLAVVWLLKVPGLLAAGGALLLWIAWKLLVGGDEGADAHGGSAGATSFWGAMRTIVIADAVMGMDNVLAVAGAAHGSYVLVVLGLAISVPIVVWGSALVLKLVERFPLVMYLGAGVLVWTGAKMVAAEPLLKPLFDGRPWAVALLYALVPLLLVAGFRVNHRRVAQRIAATVAAAPVPTPAHPPTPTADGAAASAFADTPPGDRAMTTAILLPTDGSPNALHAVQRLITDQRAGATAPQVHLLNVQPRFSRHVAQVLGRGERRRWQTERAQAALEPAAQRLRGAGFLVQTHWVVGDRAEEICRHADRLQVRSILMGTARKHSLTRMLEDSATLRVLETARVPVELVTGHTASRWERWGLPAGVLASAGGLLAMALD